MIAETITDANAVLAIGTMLLVLLMIMQTTTNSFENSGKFRFRKRAILNGHDLLAAIKRR